MKKHFVSPVEVKRVGKKLETPFEDGCTVAMISGEHDNRVQRQSPGARHLPSKKPTPVSNAEDG